MMSNQRSQLLGYRALYPISNSLNAKRMIPVIHTTSQPLLTYLLIYLLIHSRHHLSISEHFKQPLKQAPHTLVLNRLQRCPNRLHSLLTQSLLLPRIDVQARRRKNRLSKVRHNPLFPTLITTEPQDLPVRTRDHKPATSAPVIGARSTRRVNAGDSFHFLWSLGCGGVA